MSGYPGQEEGGSTGKGGVYPPSLLTGVRVQGKGVAGWLPAPNFVNSIGLELRPQLYATNQNSHLILRYSIGREQ